MSAFYLPDEFEEVLNDSEYVCAYDYEVWGMWIVFRACAREIVDSLWPEMQNLMQEYANQKEKPFMVTSRGDNWVDRTTALTLYFRFQEY